MNQAVDTGGRRRAEIAAKGTRRSRAPHRWLDRRENVPERHREKSRRPDAS